MEFSFACCPAQEALGQLQNSQGERLGNLKRVRHSMASLIHTQAIHTQFQTRSGLEHRLSVPMVLTAHSVFADCRIMA